MLCMIVLTLKLSSIKAIITMMNWDQEKRVDEVKFVELWWEWIKDVKKIDQVVAEKWITTEKD